MYEFRTIDAEVDLAPILQYLSVRPPLDVTLSEQAQGRLAPVVGGISLALALTFKTIDPSLKNPENEHWDRVRRIFDLVL